MRYVATHSPEIATHEDFLSRRSFTDALIFELLGTGCPLFGMGTVPVTFKYQETAF